MLLKLSKPAKGPSLSRAALNLTKAVATWTAAGFPVADGETIEIRKAACSACSFWAPDAQLGLGKCTNKKCGCTRVKWWLATERCPVGKWLNIQ